MNAGGWSVKATEVVVKKWDNNLTRERRQHKQNPWLTVYLHNFLTNKAVITTRIPLLVVTVALGQFAIIFFLETTFCLGAVEEIRNAK